MPFKGFGAAAGRKQRSVRVIGGLYDGRRVGSHVVNADVLECWKREDGIVVFFTCPNGSSRRFINMSIIGVWRCFIFCFVVLADRFDHGSLTGDDGLTSWSFIGLMRRNPIVFASWHRRLSIRIPHFLLSLPRPTHRSTYPLSLSTN